MCNILHEDISRTGQLHNIKRIKMYKLLYSHNNNSQPNVDSSM